MVRGSIPVDEVARAYAWWQKPLVKMIVGQDVGKFDFEEGYNLELAKAIRGSLAGVPLFSVGGNRTVSQMEHVLEQGYADLISMSRPFIREPFLVKHIREGKTDAAECESCNLCLAAHLNDMAVRCYCKGFPDS
jgi:2,4-dienoyl-CoA reductase-like NADH-dependent reductase (Old Yellow Enzyme family)